MTFGSGVNGCLGYGNYDDAPEVSAHTNNSNTGIHMYCIASLFSRSWCLVCWTMRQFKSSVERPTWWLPQVCIVLQVETP